MARIRTIKPEFPQSESMGRVSRDARLCFIEMWGIADDAGRLRGASRMLASLLFPYDDDAPDLMSRWLAELESEGCIIRYSVGGSHFIQIAKWLEHQKIDKPSPSKIPKFDDVSAKPLESSSVDLVPSTVVPSTKEQEKEDVKGNAVCVAPSAKPLSLPIVIDAPDDSQTAVAMWNEAATELGLATVQRLSDARRKKLRLRLRECGGLVGWRFALDKLRSSGCRWMLGENDRKWRADFDFLVTESKFTRLMEGGYDRAPSGGSGGNGGGGGIMDAWASVMDDIGGEDE